jgi:hypothetical protein
VEDDNTVKQVILQHPEFMEKFPQFKMKVPQRSRKRLE